MLCPTKAGVPTNNTLAYPALPTNLTNKPFSHPQRVSPLSLDLILPQASLQAAFPLGLLPLALPNLCPFKSSKHLGLVQFQFGVRQTGAPIQLSSAQPPPPRQSDPPVPLSLPSALRRWRIRARCALDHGPSRPHRTAPACRKTPSLAHRTKSLLLPGTGFLPLTPQAAVSPPFFHGGLCPSLISQGSLAWPSGTPTHLERSSGPPPGDVSLAVTRLLCSHYPHF